MPAPSCAIRSPSRVLSDVGRSVVGSVTMHPTADKTISDLTFDIYVFTEAPTAFLLLYFNITLDVDPTDRMIYEILVDREPAQSHWLLPEVTKAGELPDGWFSAVQDCVWLRKHVLPGGYFRPDIASTSGKRAFHRPRIVSVL
jgi:hypothetical protein